MTVSDPEIHFCDNSNEEHFLEELKYSLLLEFDRVSYRIIINEGDVVRIMVDVAYDDSPVYASTMLTMNDFEDDMSGEIISMTIDSLKEAINDELKKGK